MPDEPVATHHPPARQLTNLSHLQQPFYAQLGAKKTSGSLPQPQTTSDLPFDGSPEHIECGLTPDIPLHAYYWPPAGDATLPPSYVFVVLHGVRSHARLTWLVKKPTSQEAHPPLYSPLDSVTPLTTPNLAEVLSPVNAASAIEDPTWRLKLLRASLRNAEQRRMSEIHGEDRENNVFYSESWVQAFCESGAGVFALDLQGHGLSAGRNGRRCTVDTYEDYVDDLHYFIQQIVRARFPSAPLCLVGVSFSGNVVMRLLQRDTTKSLNIDSVAVIAGMFVESPALQRLPYKLLAELNRLILSRALPNAPILPLREHPSLPLWSTRVGDKDPYLHRGPFTAKMVACTVEAIKVMWRDMQHTSGTTKLLLMHNYKDSQHCPWWGTFEVYKSLVRQPGLSLRCVIFNYDHSHQPKLEELEDDVYFDVTPIDVAHTLVNDLDNGYVFRHFMQWLSQPSEPTAGV